LYAEEPRDNTATRGDQMMELYYKFNRRAYAYAQKNHAELLQTLGLDKPTTVVTKAAGQHPRAYETFATIYLGYRGELYMYVPVAYDGTHFVPAESREITGKKALYQLGEYLFAGGWDSPPVIMPVQPKGVAIPQDYDPKLFKSAKSYRHNMRVYAVLPANENDEPDTVAKAQKEYEKADKFYHAKISALLKVVRRVMTKAAQEAPSYKEAKGRLHIGFSYGHRRGELPDIEPSLSRGFGSPVRPLVPESPHYALIRGSGGNAVVRPLKKPTTPEGKEIVRLFKAVPDHRPELNEFLPSVGEHSAFVQNLGGVTVLKVSFQNAATLTTPKGTVPLTNKTYEWLEADQTDLNQSVPLPPKPAPVAKELARFLPK
ncbi:MAG TPA: hypothetical protein VIN59_05445, partial [Alphaproteobacteria bacterium]